MDNHREINSKSSSHEKMIELLESIVSKLDTIITQSEDRKKSEDKLFEVVNETQATLSDVEQGIDDIENNITHIKVITKHISSTLDNECERKRETTRDSSDYPMDDDYY